MAKHDMISPSARLKSTLNLSPHPEGGYYRRVFESENRVVTGRGKRSALTTIYYLLEAGDLSRWHVVASDEVWHFYDGEPIELLTFNPVSQRLNCVRLGRLSEGGTPVYAVAAGLWQAARPLGTYALLGCSVGPGFDFDDFALVRDLSHHGRAFEGILAKYHFLL